MSKNGANKQRAMSRVAKRVANYLVWVVLLAAPLFTYNAAAAPQYQFGTADLQIILHDDLCALKAEITNLPRRVVWKHKSEVVEGYWGYSQQFGLILLYFADKTATALPAPLFTKLTSI